MWNNKKVSLDHDYPSFILRRRREYAEVRKVLKEKRILFQTLFPARLKVKYDEETIIYNTVEEATEDMSRRGFSVTVIKPPESILEQLRRLSWNKITKKTSSGAGRGRASLGPGYKEKLRTFKRKQAATQGL